jgi:hypothetical protein
VQPSGARARQPRPPAVGGSRSRRVQSAAGERRATFASTRAASLGVASGSRVARRTSHVARRRGAPDTTSCRHLAHRHVAAEARARGKYLANSAAEIQNHWPDKRTAPPPGNAAHSSLDHRADERVRVPAYGSGAENKF